MGQFAKYSPNVERMYVLNDYDAYINVFGVSNFVFVKYIVYLTSLKFRLVGIDT